MENQGGENSVMATAREYKKGNWTVSETMVLIEAKKMDDERRQMKRITSSTSTSSEAIRNIKPAELRWKWVEDYCWNKGCCRNQNQCNDKWDNLMRDYKKVREHERRLVEEGSGNVKSYWKLEKNERKERNLPSNLLLQIYEALVDVVERRGGGGHHQQRITTSTTSAIANSSLVGCNVVDVERPMVINSVLPLLQHHQVCSSSQVLLPLPPPPQPPMQPPEPSLLPPPPLLPPLQSTQPPLSLPLPTVGTLVSLSRFILI